MSNFSNRDSSNDEFARENLVAVVRDFAAAWYKGERPSVVDYFRNGNHSERAELAAELIRVDLNRRLKLGEEARIDEYLPDIPELRNSEVELVALLIDEYALRTDAGQVVTLDEYARRFPEHLETLRNELGLTDDRHRASVISKAGCLDNCAADTGDVQTDEHEVEPGRVIGDFRIERLLGAGGVSRVFLATQLSLDRQVALKVTSECGEETSAAYEGRTMAGLSHPHIVPVFAEERTGSVRLLAMEYVAGPTLADFLALARERLHGSESRRIPTAADALSLIGELATASSTEDIEPLCEKSAVGTASIKNGTCRDFLCGVVHDIARALAAATGQGVLHCDVKPANILLTRDGKALITDFNVSLRSDTVFGKRVAVGGTLLYMSPEQLGILTGSDRDSRIDERSDIYSLGLVLFELLADGWPFLECNLSSDPLIAAGQLQASRLSSSVEYPARNRWFTPGLKSIIEKCLASEPGERYANGNELADDLDCFLNHRPLNTAAERSLIERCSKWGKRNPSRAILTGVVLACLAILVLVPRNDSSLTVHQQQGEKQSSNAEQPHSGADSMKRAMQLDLAGRELLCEEDFGSAEQQFELAVKLNPQMATSWHNLGVARFRLGEFADSLIAFDRSIVLGNESGRAYSHRAAARFALGDESGAEADFEMAIAVASHEERDEVRSNFRDFETLRATQAHQQFE